MSDDDEQFCPLEGTPHERHCIYDQGHWMCEGEVGTEEPLRTDLLLKRLDWQIAQLLQADRESRKRLERYIDLIREQQAQVVIEAGKRWLQTSYK